MTRLWFALNSFGAGVFFGILGVQADPGLAVRNPPWWCGSLVLLFAVMAIGPSIWRRAS